MIGPGQEVILTGVFLAGESGSASVDHGLGPVASGQCLTVAPVASTTYTLTLTDGLGGSETRRATVQVGALSLLAGAPYGGGSQDGGARRARFNLPEGLASDGAGTTFVADTCNHVIRRLAPAGTTTTLAGQAGARGCVDGTGAEARFNRPVGLAWDPGRQVVYVADEGNQAIRQVTLEGVVTTLAGADDGTPFADGPLAMARFSDPAGLAVDPQGDLVVADTSNHRIRRIQVAAGRVGTLAGNGNPGTQDGPGATRATFAFPCAVAVDEDGNLYVADTGNNLIRQVDATGNVTTLAGGGTQAQGSVAGDQAEFALPSGLVVLPGTQPRTLLVADSRHETLRAVVLDPFEAPRVTDCVGLCDQTGATDGDAASALFNQPGAITLGGGLCLVADTRNNLIREVHANARGGYDVTTLAGAVSRGQGLADGGPAVARFAGPRGMAFAGDRNLYVADGGNGAVRKVTPQGVVTTLAGGPSLPLPAPVGLVPVPPSGPGPGRLLVASALGPALFSLDLATGARSVFSGQPGVFGSATGPPPASTFQSPAGLAADGEGNYYVADVSAAVIYKIEPGGATSLLAGQVNQHGNQDDPRGAYATFMAPLGLAWADHALYVADPQGQTIRRIDPATTAVTTFAGLGGTEGHVDGQGGEARFNGPSGLAADPEGNLYVADTGNHAIRMLTPEGRVTTVVGRPGQSGFLPGDLPGLLYRPAWVAVQPGTGALFIGVPEAILQVSFQ